MSDRPAHLPALHLTHSPRSIPSLSTPAHLQHERGANQGIRSHTAVFHDAQDLLLAPAPSKPVNAACQGKRIGAQGGQRAKAPGMLSGTAGIARRRPTADAQLLRTAGACVLSSPIRQTILVEAALDEEGHGCRSEHAQPSSSERRIKAAGHAGEHCGTPVALRAAWQHPQPTMHIKHMHPLQLTSRSATRWQAWRWHLPVRGARATAALPRCTKPRPTGPQWRR